MRIDQPTNAPTSEGTESRSAARAQLRVDYETRLHQILNELRSKHGKAPHVQGESSGSEEIPSMVERTSRNAAAPAGESEYDRKVKSLAEKAGISLLGQSMPLDEHWSRVRHSLAVLRAHSQGVDSPQGVAMPEMRGATAAQELSRSLDHHSVPAAVARGPIEEAVEASLAGTSDSLAADDDADDAADETPAAASETPKARSSASRALHGDDAFLHAELGQSIDRIEATLGQVPKVTI